MNKDMAKQQCPDCGSWTIKHECECGFVFPTTEQNMKFHEGATNNYLRDFKNIKKSSPEVAYSHIQEIREILNRSRCNYAF